MPLSVTELSFQEQYTITSLGQLLDTLRERVTLQDGVKLAQDLLRILDVQLCDIEVACRSGQAYQTAFLSLQPHPALLPGDHGDGLRKYISDLSTLLIDHLMPQAPDNKYFALLASLRAGLVALFEVGCEPWVVHQIIIGGLGPHENDQTLKVAPQTTGKWGQLKRLLEPTPKDTNPFALAYTDHRIKGPAARLLVWLLRPAWGLLTRLANRVLFNLVRLYREPIGQVLSAFTQAGQQRDSGREPSSTEKSERRRQAAALIPRVLGSPIVPISSFDSKVVNQRMAIGVLDYVTRQVLVSGVVVRAPSNGDHGC